MRRIKKGEKPGRRILTSALSAALILSMCPTAVWGSTADNGGADSLSVDVDKTGGNVHDYGKSGDDPATAEDESLLVYSEDYLANASYGESARYSVKANQTDISVYQYRKRAEAGSIFYHMDVARFSSDDPEAVLTVNVKDGSDISNAVVYPERYYPEGSYIVDEEAGTITIQMSAELGYCILDIDGDNNSNGGDPQLAIINDPTETDKPDINGANVLNFKDFAEKYLEENPITDTVGEVCTEAGTVTDPATGLEWSYDTGYYVDYNSSQVAFPNKRVRLSYDVSDAFQAALEEVKNSDALDTIYFPAGTYVWSGLQISDWNGSEYGELNIYVDEDALLVNRLQECKEAMEPAIGIWDSSDITISGRGIFDGQGAYAQNRDSKGADQSCHQGGCMLVRSENITFNDTYVRDAKQWNWECHSGVDITYNNIKGLSPYQHSWVDGLDLTSGQNITVNGAITMGNDDCFASGHYNSSNGFGASSQTGEETQAQSNLAAAAAIYNGDRFEWDQIDSCGYSVNDTLGWSTFASGIKLGHSVNWKDNGDGTTSSYTLSDYTFNNVNTLHVYGNSTNGGGGGIQVRNGVNNGYPDYKNLVFENCSFTATEGGSSVQVPHNSTDNFYPDVVTLDNCWFNEAGTSFDFASADTVTVSDLYLNGALVKYTSQAKMNVASTVREFIFLANGEPVADNTLPAFTSPAETDRTAYVGNPMVFYVEASDADGDEVTFADVDLSGLDGAVFDKSTGEFMWTPTEADAGKTYEATFTVSDYTGSPVTETVKISVVDASAETETVYAAGEDARVASWKNNKTTNYGTGLYLTTRLLEGYGLLGEKFVSEDTNDGTDGKISYVKFDLSELADQEYLSADFAVTLIGVRGTVAEDSIRVAVVEDSSWTEDGITWVSRPDINVTEDTVLTSDVYDTSSIEVVKENALTASYPLSHTLEMRVDITEALNAALEKYNPEDASTRYLTLAFCNTSGQEVFFASREMTEQNSNASADMAPSVVLAAETELGIEGPDSANISEGYRTYKTDSFALLGKGNLTASLESDTDKITWNEETQQIEVAEGLKQGTYTAVLTVKNETGAEVNHTFTLTVSEGDQPAEPVLDRIEVTAPAQTEYYVGDELSLEGMKVTAYYSDGSSKDVTEEILADADNAVAGFDSSKAGTVTVTVTYGGRSDTFMVVIREEIPVLTGISLTPPEKTEYAVGEELDLTGMKVMAVYDNETETDVTDQAEVTGFDSAEPGEVTVSVSYGGFTKTFTVSIAENSGGQNPGENPGTDHPDDGTAAGGGDQNVNDGSGQNNSSDQSSQTVSEVKTGDNSHAAVYGIILALAGLAAAAGLRRGISGKK